MTTLATSKLDLDIGVIYTHEHGYMPALLDSLAASHAGIGARLLLIDNASSDGALQWQSHFQPMTIVRNQRRMTYAENLNRVLINSSARYVLLLNTDMYFEPAEQCLTKMVRFMDEHAQCGVAGCRLLHADGSEAYGARRFQTPRVLLARRTGLARWMEGTLTDYLYRQQSPQATFACDWLSGCFLLLRREAWRQVGQFDTQFRKYFEDVDYCLRARQQGWQVLYHGATYCYHLEQRASSRLISSDAWKHARSYVRWLRKWGAKPHTLAADSRQRAA